MSEQIYDSHLHYTLLEIGRKLEKKTTHQLEEPFIETIVQTLEYYGASDNQLKQISFDLNFAKYKIFDWLGMCYTGRLDAEKNSSVFQCIEKMVKLYVLQKHVGGFAWFLRGHDLDVQDVERCKDCIKSYDNWHNETPEQRQKNQEEKEKFYGGRIE